MEQSAAQRLRSGTSVTAIPATGYHFVSWSDGVTTSTRTDSNLTRDITVTANFALQQSFTITFVAAPHGSISGITIQTVSSGGSTTQVTAIPASGYHFVNWTGSNGFVSTSATLVVNNVMASETITAHFAPNVFTLNFSAGANGSITGTTPQVVAYNGSSSAVSAVPNTGYRFVNWTGDNGFSPTTANPLTVRKVRANQNITANFAVSQFTVTFTAGAHGSITGTTSQSVNYGGSTLPVTAVPANGYRFVGWTGTNGFTSTDNPLVLNNVTANQKIKANFVR